MGKKKAKQTNIQVSKAAKLTSVKNEKKALKTDFKSNMSRRPKWRFKKRDSDHDRWSVNMTEELLDKLSNFESMTWAQILVNAKKQNHSIKIQKLSKEAQDRLCDIKLDDYDELCSLRLTGKHRIFGILDDDGVFSIIWDDCEHEICPSQKKFT